MSLNTPTSQKAGFILLTSALFHVNRRDVTEFLTGIRSQISAEMDLSTLIESIELVEALVYPRFAQY